MIFHFSTTHIYTVRPSVRPSPFMHPHGIFFLSYDGILPFFYSLFFTILLLLLFLYTHYKNVRAKKGRNERRWESEKKEREKERDELHTF